MEFLFLPSSTGYKATHKLLAAILTFMVLLTVQLAGCTKLHTLTQMCLELHTLTQMCLELYTLTQMCLELRTLTQMSRAAYTYTDVS